MNVDLYGDLQRKTQHLEYSIRSLRENAKKYAQAEKEYRIILRKECLKLREEGYPVGVIDKVVYGIESVAAARFKRDIAEETLNANKEAINSIKLQLRLIDNQIAREWSDSNNG